MKSMLSLIFILILGHTSMAQAPELKPTEKAVASLSQSPALRHGSLACVAVNMENGEILVEHNPYLGMVPASTQKLITTGIALEKQGRDFYYETVLSYSGKIAEGTLQGDLVVKGSGDPSLGSSFISRPQDGDVPEAWARKVVALGIQEIKGDITIDVSVLAPYQVPRKWLWEDMGNYFGAAPSGLNWKDNTLHVYFNSGAEGTKTTIVGTDPIIPGLKIDNHVMAEGTKDDAWFFGSPGNDLLYAKGSIPPNKSRFKVRASIPNPATVFGNRLADAIRAEGIVFQGNIVVSVSPVTATTAIATQSSPPLIDLIGVTNKYSHNLFAEHLLISLDEAETGKSLESGLKNLLAYLESQKVETDGFRLVDGSGLSPVNRLTARGMVSFLEYMYRGAHFEDFYASLPIAGATGTLYDFLNGTPAAGNMRAKSGSMGGVRSYAGYIKNHRGETVAFCIVANDFSWPQSEIRRKIEEVLLTMME